MGGRRKKLLTVARLYFTAPEKFGRSCPDCLKWQYDERTGRPELSRVSNFTLPMARPPRSSPPCDECPKTATAPARERTWRNASDPPGWCYLAFAHWRACAAVGSFPDDRLVRRNAYLFGSIEKAAERGRSGGLLEALGLLKRK